MGYASTLTQAGFALQVKLLAQGGDLHITRVAVGSGIPADGADLTEMKTLAGALAIRQVDLTLPTDGWAQDADGRYGYRIELPVDGVTGETIPSATILPDSEEAAIECGLCNAAQTGDGVVIFRTGTIPAREIALSLALLRDSTGLVLSTSAGNVSLPMATPTSPGVVKPGPGLLVDGGQPFRGCGQRRRGERCA